MKLGSLNAAVEASNRLGALNDKIKYANNRRDATALEYLAGNDSGLAAVAMTAIRAKLEERRAAEIATLKELGIEL